MNRFIIMLLLSLLSISVFANEPEFPYSVISMRHYGVYDDTEQDNRYNHPYQNSYGRHTHTNDDTYRCSYHTDYKIDLVSANTFSNTPYMEITTILSPPNDDNAYSMPSGIRPRQHTLYNDDKEDDDLHEPETYDPQAVPVGDIPWPLMFLLIVGYVLHLRKSIPNKPIDS